MKCDEKIKRKVPDFSGKYHGKLNNKISRKNDVKISIKCNCRKKAITKNHQSLKGKYNGKNRVKNLRKT